MIGLGIRAAGVQGAQRQQKSGFPQFGSDCRVFGHRCTHDVPDRVPGCGRSTDEELHRTCHMLSRGPRLAYGGGAEEPPGKVVSGRAFRERQAWW